LKVLYIGGQKSGKSSLAERKILSLADKKPYYIATYDNSFDDDEMQKRVDIHKKRREESFVTLEEPLYLDRVIEDNEFYLVDCLSMWIMNTLEKGVDFKDILKRVLKKDATIVFVLNDVNSGIIPQNRLAREYIDISGIVGQITAASCDEVYHVIVGLENRLK